VSVDQDKSDWQKKYNNTPLCWSGHGNPPVTR
jgi:hypothetical protein